MHTVLHKWLGKLERLNFKNVLVERLLLGAGEGSMDNSVCYGSVRIWIWSPRSHIKNWVWSHMPVTHPYQWQIPEFADQPAWPKYSFRFSEKPCFWKVKQKEMEEDTWHPPLASTWTYLCTCICIHLPHSPHTSLHKRGEKDISHLFQTQNETSNAKWLSDTKWHF